MLELDVESESGLQLDVESESGLKESESGLRLEKGTFVSYFSFVSLTAGFWKYQCSCFLLFVCLPTKENYMQSSSQKVLESLPERMRSEMYCFETFHTNAFLCLVVIVKCFIIS